MKPAPSDDEMRQAYAVFEREHDSLRGELLAAVARGDHERPRPHCPAPQRSWLAYCVTAIAASLAIAAGLWFAFAGLDSRPVYALEGIHDRLVKIRSLHVTGWMYQTVVVDGQEKREKFPYEHYEERPSRSWNIWYGFSPEVVRTGYSAIDGSRQMHVSHTDKLATLGEGSQLATELSVERQLQNHWAQRIIGRSETDYRLIGKEEVNGVRARRYECIRDADGETTRTVVWLDPATGLPVRSADYVRADGKEQLSHLNDRIETNVPPRPDMFSFQIPDGYTLNQPARQHDNAIEPRGEPFVPASGSAGGRQAAIRDMFAIDDHAVLVCWMNQPRSDEPVKQPGEESDTLKIKLELTGPTGKRLCRAFPVRTQQDQDQVWHWALVMPCDRQSIKTAEELNVVFKSRRSQMGFGQYLLRFDDERLATLLARLQRETFTEQPAEDGPFTLADLRRQLERIVAQPIDAGYEEESP